MSYKPSRRAVALEYGRRKAPVMTAKGQGEVAELIIEEAKEAGHPHCRRSPAGGAAGPAGAQ